MNRRNFLQANAAFALGALNYKDLFAKTFYVKTSCLVPGMAKNIYEAHLNKVLNINGIIELDQSFFLKGKLLSSKTEFLDDGRIWHYYFRTEEDYNSWDKLLEVDGRYNSSYMPDIFQFQIEKLYI